MVEIAAGVGVAWARRDGAGVVVAAMVSSALSVLAALVPVGVALLSPAVSAVAFVLVASSVLPVLLLVSAACACCSAAA